MTPTDRAQNDHTAANGTLRRSLVIGLISFLTLVDLIGAKMMGPRAEHLAHLLAGAHQSNLTVDEMLERLFYHPVVELGLRTALRMLNAALAMGSLPISRCLDCGPGA